MWIEAMPAVLSTFALHSGVLLTIAWAVDRGALRRQPAWRELLWRVALFGAALTAGVQAFTNMPTSWRLAWPSAPDAPVAMRADAARVAGVRDEPLADAAVVAASERSGADTPRPVEALVRGAPAAVATAWRMPSWPSLLLAAWLAGVVLVLARLALAWLRLERTVRRVEPAHDAPLAAAAEALAIHARIAPPRLGVLDDLAGPIAVGRRGIVLPRWALELLDREQLRAMLAHETAHLARRDPLWRSATAFWCALLWFLPLAALARRRLDETAELACDAWAARHLGDGRVLAECLAECAEHRAGAFESALAAGMAQRESPLLQRIDYLIGGSPMDTTLSRARAAAAVMFALALASVALPGFGTAAAQPAPPNPPVPPSAPPPPAPPKDGGKHLHISGDIDAGGGKREYTSVRIDDDGHQLDVQIKGKIAFNDDEDDVASLSDGGSASFAETKRGVERRVDYALRGGRVAQRYFVDDREQPIDAAGRAWIAALIPNVVRDTVLGAEARVKRFYAKGGADAVLDEIGRIQSGYARRVYLEQLFALGKLAPAQVTRVLGVIDGLDSDYERRNALTALAAIAPFDEAQQKLVIGMAEKIGSDYERAELLTGVLPRLAGKPELRAAWLAAAEKIGSDYERRRTLGALLDTDPIDDAILAEVIRATDAIGSDYERRELLAAAVRRAGDSERIAASYVVAVDGIGSDYERREALLALVRAPKFGQIGARGVLDAAARIGSDHECREVLVALARVMPRDADMVARYRGVARRLSDSDRGAVERALDRAES